MLYGTDAINRVEALENPRVGQSQVTCEIMWAFPQLSCHSCSYGTLIGCWPYIPCETRIHKCRRCFTSYLTETLFLSSEIHTCVDDFDLYNVLRIPVHHYCSRTVNWFRIPVIPRFRYLNKEIMQICIWPYQGRGSVYTLSERTF